MKILSVVGARPQFVKLSPMARALEYSGHEHIIVHTGQHYDPMLSEVFFRDLEIPQPNAHLHIGSSSHGKQTGAMLTALEETLVEHDPDCVLTYGDTNSTLAASLSAVKLHYPLVHLEAGLRSFNRKMPEEHNRVLSDHAADLCLAPTEVAMLNLAQEGLAPRSVLVGDVMTDVLLGVKNRVNSGFVANPIAKLVQNGSYLLATIHRAENTDDPRRLETILNALANADQPVVLLAHPRLRARSVEFSLPLEAGALRVIEPLAYPELVAAMMASAGLITDSGGLQKEAFLLEVPCTTVRFETEWVETLESDWNVLANTPDEIAAAISRPRPQPVADSPFGQGDAAIRAVSAIENLMHASHSNFN